jgi:type VI protein secretion system component Hcp
MHKKTHKQQQRSSTDALLKTTKKKDIELTEKELGKVTGGNKNSPVLMQACATGVHLKESI